MGFFSKISEALIKTSDKISNSLEHIFIKKRLDQDSLEELETLLLSADVGTAVTAQIINNLKFQKFNKEVTAQEIKEYLAKIMLNILEQPAGNITDDYKGRGESGKQHGMMDNKSGNNNFIGSFTNNLILESGKLNIILFCGVNGSGKTTTIGKLAAKYIAAGKKVAIAACDTFRAAAAEQLTIWAERSGATVYKGIEKADPAGVAYNAVMDATDKKFDILFIDTAGRLHNQKNLMDELAKIIRVIKKLDPVEPSHSLLVIDGTIGQNSFVQARQFKSIADISGLIITKLDGTAKAGVVIGLVQELKLPIYFIGVGEKQEDLKAFVASEFVGSLLGLN